jgi:glycosyltransferase involved in cell wall biosynthesis
MENILVHRFKIDKNRLFFDYNKVKINKFINLQKDGKFVLFLNGMKKWRRIDLVIKSIKIVIEKVPDARFLLVGVRNQKERNFVEKLIKEEGVNQYVELFDWTNTPQEYYQKSSIFVLPADLIFCNFSLLESMERGLPAIVSNVADADKIVIHGINGYLCDQNEYSLAHYIILLLSDENLRMKMGGAARQTITEFYNDEDRIKPIIKLIHDREKNFQN